MSTATLDPTAAIAAAVQDLYDQLRQIVDRGPTSDPKLLDELRQLTRRIGGRITRARKRHDETPESGPTAAPTASKAAEVPSTSTPTANATATPTPASQPPAEDSNARPRPASPATKSSFAFTVRLPAPSTEAPTTTGGSRSTRRALRSVQQATRTASFTIWKVGRAVVAGLVLAAIAVLIGQGMADSGVPAAWVGVWSIGCLVAFVAGLCMWASRAANRWGQEIDGRVPVQTLIGTVPLQSGGRHRRRRG